MCVCFFTWRRIHITAYILYFGFSLTPLTVNKMVCLYFYHPGGAPWLSWFFVFLFGLVHFYVFLRAFSGAVFGCFLSCFFWCLLVILLVVFFVLFRVLFPLYSGAFFRAFFRACPFSFLYMFPLGGFPVFCPAFFGGFWVLFPCFFPCFFRGFFLCFFLCLLSCFFSCIFFFFLVLFFVLFFSCLGRHPRQATTIFCILARVFFGAFSGGHY